MIFQNGIMVFNSTPYFLQEAELIHLNGLFNRKKKLKNTDHEVPKLLPEQALSGFYKRNIFDIGQKSSFKYTNNGIYTAQECLEDNVVQIDIHSALPTVAYALGLFNEHYHMLKEICKRVGVNNGDLPLTCYTLRTTCGTRLARLGDYSYACNRLGNSLAVYMRYYVKTFNTGYSGLMDRYLSM